MVLNDRLEDKSALGNERQTDKLPSKFKEDWSHVQIHIRQTGGGAKRRDTNGRKALKIYTLGHKGGGEIKLQQEYLLSSVDYIVKK